MSGKRSFRCWWWALAAALAVVVAGGAARLWLLEGWLRSIRIEGASMAPAFSGTHLAVTCSDCGIAFRCDGEHLPQSGSLVCPNCGYRDLQASAFGRRRGDTVLVDRWPLLTGVPRRGAVVAFDDVLAGGLAVKRIAGLPGETLSIRDGDLHANGQIVRKSLLELRQVAVLVHDNEYLPRSLAGSGGARALRWKPQNPAGGWQAAGSGFRYRPTAEAAPEADWLEYVHWRCDASLTPRDAPSAILDNDPYNQAKARRLNVVGDLLLTCDVQFPASGSLTLAMLHEDGLLKAELDADTGAIIASHASQELATAVAPRELAGQRVSIEFGQCDEQLLLAIDARPVLAAPLNRRRQDSGRIASTSLIRVGCAGGSFDIRHLQVWRDLYLLEPLGTDRAWNMNRPLATGEFLLLGDNPSVSIDSRHWINPGLERAKMRGVVLGPPPGSVR